MNHQKINLTQVMCIISVAVSLVSSAYAHEVPQANAAETVLHRIERLVILSKIEDGFRTNISSISLSKLTQTQPSDPVYKISGTQVKGSDLSARSIDLFTDEDGKTLDGGKRYTVNAGAPSVNPPVFSDKDALTLMETSLHCVQGELIDVSHACMDSSLIKPFSEGFRSAKMLALRNADNSLKGVMIDFNGVDASGTPLPDTLRIRLNLNATLDAAVPLELVR